MIIASIPIDESDSSDDGYAEWDTADDFAIWAIKTARMKPGEFPLEALMTREASVYVGQVMNGGHWQYLVNCGIELDTMTRVERCLPAAGLADQLSIFQDFRSLLAANPGWLASVGQSLIGSSSRAELSELDDRFYKADSADTIVAGVGAWLRQSGLLLPMSREEIAAWRQDILDANPDLALRPGFAGKI